MTTPKQLDANRRNAAFSTGPKTSGGRTRSAKNAVRHGAFSCIPVLPGLERAEDWESHQAGILESLAPLGGLEETLADRVAVCSWRLGRTIRYETAITTVGLEKIEDSFRSNAADEPSLEKVLKKLEEKRNTLNLWSGRHHLLVHLHEMPDEATVAGPDVFGVLEDVAEEKPDDQKGYFDIESKNFLARLGVPNDELDEPFSWSGWTAGMVRQAVAQMAQEYKKDPHKLLAKALEGRQEDQAECQSEITALESKAKKIRRSREIKKDRMVRELMLPNGDTLQQVARYEAHLSRQMLQALHELQRLQANRAGAPIPPPVALDVTLNASGMTLEALNDGATG